MTVAPAVALLVLLLATPAAAQTPGSAPPVPDVLTVPAVTDRSPPGWRLSARRVIMAAERHARVRDEIRARPRRTYSRAYLKGDRRWQVSVFERGPGQDEEVAQAFVDDRSGRVLEAWSGIQVAWTMARGYEGAFGRRANAPWVWLPLLALFVAPFLRPPLRLVHLDVLVLAAFSAAYALFSAAEIGTSVAITHPLLAYLLVRMLMLARARGRPGGQEPRPPLRLLLGPGFLAIAVVFLIGFRVGLNVTSSNVIDVGYAGVIGADRIADGEDLYGSFPEHNQHGDTYGPATYLAYVPFEQALAWGGSWDDLPAAHAAALAFDLACMGLLWLLGRRLRGPDLGVLLAYLWAAFPFTLLVSNSNANDSLVAALVLLALVLAGRPALRGAATAAAGMAKFAPLALAPLMLRSAPRRAGAGFTLAAALLALPVLLLDGGFGELWERAIRFQAERESPFSPWGYWHLGGAQLAVQLAAAALALAVAFVPRRRDEVSTIALAAAVLIALQLGVEHWFYLYIVWFTGPVLAASLGEYQDGSGRSTGSIEEARPGASARITTPISQGSMSELS